MPAFTERVADLVLHLGLVDFPGGDFPLHLGLVLRVLPPRVRGVKNDCNAHGSRSMGPGCNASPLLVLRGLPIPAKCPHRLTTHISNVRCLRSLVRGSAIAPQLAGKYVQANVYLGSALDAPASPQDGGLLFCGGLQPHRASLRADSLTPRGR